jgi:hypothetical protein
VLRLALLDAVVGYVLWLALQAIGGGITWWGSGRSSRFEERLSGKCTIEPLR